MLEGARDGRTAAELMDTGRRVLTRADVMEGVPELVSEVQVEATFPDGTKLVTAADGTIGLNTGRASRTLTVENTGDRPVQVGSHYHFAEVNPALEFDRAAARGFRLDVQAGTSVRFEPGIRRDVALVVLGGAREVWGLRGETAGPLEEAMAELDRRRHAALYGPTTGDRIRLADTDLVVRVEEDRSGGPCAGDEAVFGGGKVIGESQGQSRATRAEGTPDLVVTGAVIIDHWGIVKADLGVRDGRSSPSARPATPRRWTASTPTS